MGAFFRDHQLSDLVGFTYSQWDPNRAAMDFCNRLLSIKSHIGGDQRVIPIILDGENAWEYYENNAYDFLQKMYANIAASPELTLTTCSAVLEHTRFDGRLHGIHPGSWINANYGIWIGHPEENLGWDLLAQAREAAVTGHPGVAALLAGEPSGPFDETAERICRSLYAAEGSDWFWWYGDDHFSPHSDRFDRLFRLHLMNVYRLLQQDPPRELLEPIKKRVRPAWCANRPPSSNRRSTAGSATTSNGWLPGCTT